MGSRTVHQAKGKRSQLIIYTIGFILLAYFSIISSDNLTQGILVLLAYIPLFLFARYLHRHGGMGWTWPD